MAVNSIISGFVDPETKKAAEQSTLATDDFMAIQIQILKELKALRAASTEEHEPEECEAAAVQAARCSHTAPGVGKSAPVEPLPVQLNRRDTHGLVRILVDLLAKNHTAAVSISHASKKVFIEEIDASGHTVNSYQTPE